MQYLKKQPNTNIMERNPIQLSHFWNPCVDYFTNHTASLIVGLTVGFASFFTIDKAINFLYMFSLFNEQRMTLRITLIVLVQHHDLCSDLHLF